MENTKLLEKNDVDAWVKQWALAFWMADRMFGLREKIDDASIDKLVQAVFDHLADSQALQSAPTARDNVPVGDGHTPTQMRLKNVAYSLLNFSACHFAFVIDSFYQQRYFAIIDATSPHLSPADAANPHPETLAQFVKIPPGFPNFALRGVLSKVCGDIMTLHAIWSQYADGESTSVQTGLRMSNQLAAAAWKRLRKYLPLMQAPIVYARPSTGARLTPYSNIPLISIPPTAVVQPNAHADIRPEDAMAIPHELGHFVYWRGVTPTTDIPMAQAIQKAIDSNTDEPLRLSHWVEEVFADVVATLIGGPAAVMSLISMLREKIGRHFVEDDGHYPIAAVRPYAAMLALRRCGIDTTQLADDWQTVLAQWLPDVLSTRALGAYPLFVCVENADQSVSKESISLGTVRTEVERLADVICDVLLADTDGQVDPDLTDLWRTGMGSSTQSSDAATATQVIAAMLADSPTDLSPAPIATDLMWRKAVHSNLNAAPMALAQEEANVLDQLDWVLDVLSHRPLPDGSKPLAQLTKQEWSTVLYFGGWGDAGPTGGSPIIT